MTSRKTQKTKTKMALLALPFFDFSVFSKLFGGPLNSDYILAILLVFLAFLSLWFVLIFFQKIRKASPRLFYFLSLALILGGFAYGTDRFIQRELDFEESGIQIPKRIGNSAVKGENDFAGEDGVLKNESPEGISFEEVLTSGGIWWNEKGDPHGALQIRNNRIKIKTGRVSSRAIKDETIRDEDIDDDIKLHVQDLFVSRNVEIDGTATFQNGASIANGNMTISGNITVSDVLAEDITADSYNGLTLTSNADGFSISGGAAERTLTVTGSNIALTGGGNTLVLTGDAELDQDVSTAGSPSFAGLTIDTDTIFVDSTLSYVGIGTTTPGFKLDVVGGVNADNLYVDGIVLNGTSLASTEEGTAVGQTLYWDGSIWSYSNNIFNNGTGVGIGTITPGAGYELDVVGDGRFSGSLTVGGGFIMGTTNTDYLVVNGTLNSHLIPASNNVYDLGSPSYFYRNIYTNTLVANNISAGGTNISGTTAETLALNTDNVTVDAEDSYLIFTRGTVTPNGTLRWNSTSDRFEFNQDLWIQDETPASGSTLVSIKAGAGQGTDNLMQWLDSSNGVLGFIDYAGNITTSGSFTPSGTIYLADGSYSSPSLAFVNDTNSGLYRIGADKISLITAGVEGNGITINSSGQVGIGTITPGTKLDVRGGISAGTNGTEFVLSAAGVITTGTWNGTSIADAYIDDNITLSNLTQLTTRSHADLQNLLVDDHTQYALLAGRAGGQTLIGGTVASNNLTLSSTSNGTKGNILFGTSAYDEVNNRLGIGTASPDTALDLVGSLTLENTVSSTTGVIYKGATPFMHNFQASGTDGRNTFIGVNSGNFTMVRDLTDGDASFNTGVGDSTLNDLTTGHDNSAFGGMALSSITSGYDNSSFGRSSLVNNTVGAGNSVFGNFAMHLNESGSYNVAIGRIALYENTTGSGNVVIGAGAGYLSGGSANIIIGVDAGTNLVSGSNNIIIGSEVNVFGGSTVDDTLNIGNLIFGTGVDGTGTILSSGNVGIGTASPGAKLDIRGGINAGTNGTEFILSTGGVITTGTWNGTSITDSYVDNNITLAGGTISGASNTVSLGSDATGDIYYRNSSGYLTRLAIGASGTILQGGTTPSWSTATYPSTATGTGTILRANGTNWVASTSTLADTFGINTLLYASSANTVTGLATGNSGVLVTNGSGVPSWSSITADTFTQYILANGTRAFTGSQSLGDFNITNVGDISLDSISSDAGTGLNIVLGSDAGDDFTVDTDKLVVEGDTGNVGIGVASPTAKLYVDQTAASNLIDFRDGGTSIFQIADGGLISMHGSITYNSAAKPKRSIILTSSGATIPTSGGATQTKVDGANHTYYVLDFGDATDSSSFWQWTMPDSYDGGTIDVTFYWEAAATTGDVVWAAQTAGVDPDNTEDVDPTLGSAQTVTDTAQGNANDLASATISSWSPSWAAGDYIVFKAYRDADAGGDTLSGNARLVKVKVEYSVSSESD